LWTLLNRIMKLKLGTKMKYEIKSKSPLGDLGARVGLRRK